MILETALALVFDADKIQKEGCLSGGVLTPATAAGLVLLERLKVRALPVPVLALLWGHLRQICASLSQRLSPCWALLTYRRLASQPVPHLAPEMHQWTGAHAQAYFSLYVNGRGPSTLLIKSGLQAAGQTWSVEK